jgi:hypothetical protein
MPICIEVSAALDEAFLLQEPSIQRPHGQKFAAELWWPRAADHPLARLPSFGG